jgi:hypothetical protein
VEYFSDPGARVWPSSYAHVVIDSEKIDAMLLMDIEDILYGAKKPNQDSLRWGSS